jgi:hypothetical protein
MRIRNEYFQYGMQMRRNKDIWTCLDAIVYLNLNFAI